MLGNYSNVGYEQDFNPPKIEVSPIPDPTLQAIEMLADNYLKQKEAEQKKDENTCITIDNEKRTESLQINPCVHGQLIFYKGPQDHSIGKGTSFQQWC